MARPLFTGNYGASLAQINTAPIERAGAAMGQAFSSIGTSIATAMEKRREKKEKKEKEEALATRFIQRAEANPEVLKTLGVPNEPDAIREAANAYAKHPEAMALEMNLSQLEQRTQQMQMAKAAEGRAAGMYPYQRDLAKGQLSDLEFQRQQRMDEQSAKDLLPYVGQLPSGQLGLDPATSEGIPSGIVARAVEMKKAEMAAKEKARLNTLKTMSDIGKTRAETLKLIRDASNVGDKGNVYDSIAEDMERLDNMPVPIQGVGTITYGQFKKIKEEDGDAWKQMKKRVGNMNDPNNPLAVLNKREKDLVTKSQQELRDEKTTVVVTKPDGTTEVKEVSVLEALEIIQKQEAEQAKRRQQEAKTFSSNQFMHGLDPSSYVF